MHTIALLSQKGGAGKSTIARQLSVVASEHSDCLLIDLDPQKTTTGWWQRRQRVEPAPAMPQLLDLEGKPVSKALSALGSKAGFAFIDTRPAVTEQEAEVARLANTVIVPVRPSPDDLAAVKDTLAMLRRIKKTPLIIVNAAKNQRRAIDARAALSRFGVPVCPFHIADRAAYLDAALSGLGMSEIRGAGAAEAYAELSKIWQWIEEIRSGEA